MKSVVQTVLFLSVSLLSCRAPAPVLVPSTSEQLLLAVQPNPVGEDPLPRVRISGGSGSVTIVMTKHWVCGGSVSAGVNRAAGDLAVVVRQVFDSSAVCVPMIAVVDYTGTVEALSAGSYRVRVFETQNGSRSRLLESATVSVSPNQATVATPTHQAPYRMHTGPNSTPLAAGTRLAIQFDDEPVIVQVADGRGGPPLLYHGKEIKFDDLKSIRILKTKEARERFGDQTLDGAILIEFK